MFTALASLLTGKPIRNDVAMTGEITLRGNVLPVGGIKEKILAAHRAGIKRIIMPERNQKDMVDVPDQAKNEMEFFYVKKIDELLPLALTRDAGEVRQATSTVPPVVVTPPTPLDDQPASLPAPRSRRSINSETKRSGRRLYSLHAR